MTLGITHIVNASGVPNTFPKTFTYLYIDIKDKETSNVLSCIPTTNIFIEAGIDAGAVLVHCYGGVSRSAALVAAFLMSSYGWSYEQAIREIKSKRSVIFACFFLSSFNSSNLILNSVNLSKSLI
jgi:protein-tyrosine phosphatase